MLAIIKKVVGGNKMINFFMGSSVSKVKKAS